MFGRNKISSDNQTDENGPDRSPDDEIEMVDAGRHFQIDHRVGLCSPAEEGEADHNKRHDGVGWNEHSFTEQKFGKLCLLQSSLFLFLLLLVLFSLAFSQTKDVWLKQRNDAKSSTIRTEIEDMVSSEELIVQFVETMLSTYNNQIYIGGYINCCKKMFSLSKLRPR